MTAPGPEVRKHLDRILTTFTGCGVGWVLLRGRAELATGRDVDLLVATAHLAIAEEVIFELGGVPLPQLKYPWHRMYLIDVPGAETKLKLDIVDRLTYSREREIVSNLERGCLDRRICDEPLFLLSPTDAFWTILLHCVLDKQRVMGHRADELTSGVDEVERPSPGEEFFASLCPPEWSAERAVECVVRRDWEPLSHLGGRILSLRSAETSAPPVRAAAQRAALHEQLLRLVDKAVRVTSSAAAYQRVWRGLGLVVVPDVYDVVEEALVAATVVELRRRPGRCDVVLVVEEHQLQRLLLVMRGHYRLVAGSWRRLSSTGLESVCIVPASNVSPGERPDGAVGEASLPLPGRSYCSLASISPRPEAPGGADPRRDQPANS